MADREYSTESYGEYAVRKESKRFYKEERIRSVEDAYLIGYMACDGSYIENRGYPFMGVNSKNYEILEGFRNTYCPDNTIYFVGKKSSEKVKAISDVWELRFPPRMRVLWNNHGIFSRKLHRRVVGIRNEYLYSYFAGVVDSDGFISVCHRKDTRTPRLRVFITHESEKFLADLQNRLEVNSTLRQHGNNVFRLQLQNTEQNKPFLRKVLPYIRDKQRNKILKDYLYKYYDVPQASGELLEAKVISSQAVDTSAEGSETTGGLK